MATTGDMVFPHCTLEARDLLWLFDLHERVPETENADSSDENWKLIAGHCSARHHHVRWRWTESARAHCESPSGGEGSYPQYAIRSSICAHCHIGGRGRIRIQQLAIRTRSGHSPLTSAEPHSGPVRIVVPARFWNSLSARAVARCSETDTERSNGI